MAVGRCPKVAPAWTIRSVALRTRDGPERLDQAYRRLLAPEPPDRQPAAPDAPAPTTVSEHTRSSRR